MKTPHIGMHTCTDTAIHKHILMLVSHTTNILTYTQREGKGRRKGEREVLQLPQEGINDAEIRKIISFKPVSGFFVRECPQCATQDVA